MTPPPLSPESSSLLSDERASALTPALCQSLPGTIVTGMTPSPFSQNMILPFGDPVTRLTPRMRLSSPGGPDLTLEASPSVASSSSTSSALTLTQGRNAAHRTSSTFALGTHWPPLARHGSFW